MIDPRQRGSAGSDVARLSVARAQGTSDISHSPLSSSPPHLSCPTSCLRLPGRRPLIPPIPLIFISHTRVEGPTSSLTQRQRPRSVSQSAHSPHHPLIAPTRVEKEIHPRRNLQTVGRVCPKLALTLTITPNALLYSQRDPSEDESENESVTADSPHKATTRPETRVSPLPIHALIPIAAGGARKGPRPLRPRYV